MRRVCLYAGYDPNNKIQDYVVYMLKKLSMISDVYYMGNGNIPPDELFKLAPFTKMFYTSLHHQRDFGSWQRLISQIGWGKLSLYDELILCNDSVYGPLRNLEDIFMEMESRGYDFWSITADYAYNFHLHSYFMVFNNNVIKDKQFQYFWNCVPHNSEIQNCSIVLTPLLFERGFIGNSYIRSYRSENIMEQPQKMLDDFNLPFVKTKSFLPNNKYSSGSGFALRYNIRTKSDYDTKMINRHIKTNHLPQNLKQKLATLSGL